MVPKKETWEAEEKTEERKTTRTITKPETKIGDRGKLISPSENLATVQKIIEIARPTTSNRPLEVVIGILVKGKKKTGNKITTKDNEINEILFKILDHIIC